MARTTLDVDLFNPGQVLACIGLAEIAEIVIGGTEAAFAWNEGTSRFTLGVPGEHDPLREACAFLSRARVSSMAATRSRHGTEKWGVPTVRLDTSAPFPIPEPDSPATLPAVLSGDGVRGPARLVIDHWGDADTGRDPVKFWAGAGGYPGAALARDGLDLVRERLPGAADPLSLAAAQSSSFRLDWRRDYIPIDIGFSLNNHSKIATRGYPVVEILAAIGLTHARPRRDKNLEYRYSVIRSSAADALVPLSFLRAAIGMAVLPFDTRVFRIELGWPGQEGQARSITTVTEESNS